MSPAAEKSSSRDVRVQGVLLASAGIIILGCLVLNALTWNRLKSNTTLQNDTLDRLAQYTLVLSTLQDIELAQRGYVITGAEDTLELFDDARERYATEWEELVRLENQAKTNPVDLEKFRANADELIKHAIEIVFQREKDGQSSAISQFQQNRPPELMRKVRAQFIERKLDLEEEVRKYSTASEDDFEAGLATTIALGFIALGIGALSFFLLRRVIREIKRSETYALSMLKAEEERRQKDVFLAMMSHEIRTPLNAIIGFSELARKEKMSPQAERYIQSILGGGKSLLLLINDILDLSKLEAGKMQLNEEPTELRTMVGFIERLFGEAAAEKGIRIQAEYQEDFPPALILDSVRLRQILMNLVGNAVKFTDSGGVTLRVSGSPESTNSSQWRLVIEIEDTGKGMADKDLEHVFEPFYQSKDGGGGTGLGLSIVSRFVKLMGGEVTVTSKSGKGTTFKIVLPRVGVSARIVQDATSSTGDENFDHLKKSKILAVDDNETNLMLIQEIFKDSHHEIRTAGNGRLAIDTIEEWRPDLILMDLRMPVMDGPSAAEEIKSKKDSSLIPIIAVTAGSLPDVRDEPVPEDVFDGALRKPFTREQIFDALAQFVPPSASPKEIEEAEEKMEPRDEISTSPEVVEKLQVLLSEEWPDVKAGMTVSEISQFLDKLEDINESENCRRLGVYIRNLKNAVESFSFGEMESVLKHFPDLVTELRESIN